MSILDPDSDIASVARRDRNATEALGAIIRMYSRDMIEPGETKAEMFARNAYAVADAMERQRKANQ